MKILQVCYIYPPFFSGYGMQLYTINEQLVRSNSDLEIVVLTAYGEKKKSKELRAGRHLVRCLVKTKSKKGIFFYTIFVFFVAIRFIKEFFRADVVHIVKAGPEVIVPMVIAKILNKKVIVKVAQDDLEGLLIKHPSLIRKLRCFLLRKVDYLVALSGKIAKEAELLGVPKERIKRISNGVDFNRFNYNERVHQGRNSPFRSFIFVGAISRRKGVEDLLRALEDYRGDPILFSFVGPLYDVNDFERRLQEISANGCVVTRYHGAVERPEIFMKMHDCLVLPSYNEGMPNVVLEAMACGLYVILSDIAVHQELCELGEGSCFNLGDPADLLSKMVSFLSVDFNDARRSEQSISIANVASVQNVGAQYLFLYGVEKKSGKALRCTNDNL